MRITLPVLLALVVGFVLGTTVDFAPAREGPGPSNAPGKRPALTEVVSDPPGPSAASNPASEHDSKPVEPRAARTAEGLISEALARYARDELQAGWSEVRKDAMPPAVVDAGFARFDVELQALPRAIGRDLAGDATQREKLASDDPFEVLDALNAGDLGPQVALVQDAQRFARFFACSGGARIDGLALLAMEPEDAAGVLQPGSTIVFPPGVHDVDPIAQLLRKDVACVAIVGAGMDRTQLRARSFSPNARLDRFELRDCTFRSSCDAIDLNTGVWRAERVRFVGFDCGAGGCGVFSVMRGAVLELVGCRIEGGYGRNPGDGCLFDVRTSALLAHFQDCTIDGLKLQPRYWRRGVTIVFDRCRLQNLLDGELPPDDDDDGIVLNATTVELRPEDAGPIAARDLRDVNPAW